MNLLMCTFCLNIDLHCLLMFYSFAFSNPPGIDFMYSVRYKSNCISP